MLLQISLKFLIYLSHGGFLSDFQIFRAIVSHNASPQRIIKIQNKCLLILSKDRLDDMA